MRLFWWLMEWEWFSWIIKHIPIPVFLGHYAELRRQSTWYTYMMIKQEAEYEAYKMRMAEFDKPIESETGLEDEG